MRYRNRDIAHHHYNIRAEIEPGLSLVTVAIFRLILLLYGSSNTFKILLVVREAKACHLMILYRTSNRYANKTFAKSVAHARTLRAASRARHRASLCARSAARATVARTGARACRSFARPNAACSRLHAAH
eukprot:6200169-Pleurochrysis_carterae.AAC.2